MARSHRSVLRFIEQHQGKHVCACGCGAVIPITANHYSNGVPKYVHGHNQGFHGTPLVAVQEWVQAEQGKHLCQCGCGEPVQLQDIHHSRGIPKFVHGHHARLREYPDLAERFWKFVAKDGSNGCWRWLGSKIKGYGRIQSEGNIGNWAHRASYVIHRGEIPESMDVLHRCDNPECTNPDHLFLGTHADNMRDAAVKGRLASKITAADAVEIVGLVKSGVSIAEAGRRFGLTSESAWAVVHGKSWSHATGIIPGG